MSRPGVLHRAGLAPARAKQALGRDRCLTDRLRESFMDGCRRDRAWANLTLHAGARILWLIKQIIFIVGEQRCEASSFGFHNLNNDRTLLSPKAWRREGLTTKSEAREVLMKELSKRASSRYRRRTVEFLAQDEEHVGE